MECVLRIIQGPEQGATYRLGPGETIVGRGAKAHIKLSPASVSWEHAVFTRNGEDWFVENLSANGTFVNDAKINTKTRLRVRDQIRLSPETALQLASTDGSSGALERYRGWLIGVGAVLLLIVLVVLWNPFSGSAPPEDWNRGYATLLPWVEAEAAAGRLPREFTDAMVDGWRRDKVSDYKGSRQSWARAQLILDGLESKEGYNAASQKHPRALRQVLRTKRDASFDQEEYRAATEQWVQARLEYAARAAKE